MRPTVTCIVPVYNGERHLREALESILAQTYRPLEIVVVDDGSTDGSRRIALDVGCEAPGLRLVAQANAGPATARNTGLANARGDLIGFLDADDLWHPEKLARQAARLEARPELDYCVHHIQNFWESEHGEEAAQYANLARGGPIPAYVTQAMLARRSAFERVGPLDTRFKHGDSMDWFLRANACGLIGELLPDVLAFRRMHRDNRSRTYANRSLDEFFGILKKSIDRKRADPEMA